MADEELEACMASLSASEDPVQSHRRAMTRHPADCVAFAPCSNLMAVGGYRLREGPVPVKEGRIEWFLVTQPQHLQPEQHSGNNSRWLRPVGGTCDADAILDLAWRPVNASLGGGIVDRTGNAVEREACVLATADSGGRVRFGCVDALALHAWIRRSEQQSDAPSLGETNAAAVLNSTSNLQASDDPFRLWTEPMFAPGAGAVVGEGADVNDMALSLEWQLSTLPVSGFDPATVITSTSKGRIALASMALSEDQETGFLAVGHCGVDMVWEGHEFEAWTAACHRSDPNVVYSGGDDCFFKVWDTRTAESGRAALLKRFDMGVTSIQHSPHAHDQPFTVAVGSYDESLTLFDCRMLARPQVRIDGLGGGVWRIKWHPTDPMLIAAPCMRAGFRVLQLGVNSSDTMHFQDQVSFREADCEPIAYGIDWVPAAQTRELATCSFYDRRVELWSC